MQELLAMNKKEMPILLNETRVYLSSVQKLFLDNFLCYF